MLGKDYEAQDCLLARALEVIGERWTLLIVRDAFFGVRRFSDFQAHLDIPKAVLSERLKGLVGHGILERKPDTARPGRKIYELTPAGIDLWPVLFALRSWSVKHRSRDGIRRRYDHASCGTELDAVGWCEACGVTPVPADVLMSLRPKAARRREDRVSRALTRPHRLLAPVAVEDSAA